MLQNIRTLSSDAFEGRRTGTKGADKAREYIINQFHALNVLPLNTNYEQKFSFYTKRKFEIEYENDVEYKMIYK